MFWRVRTNLDEYELRSPCHGSAADRGAGRDALDELIRHKDEPDVRKTLNEVYVFMEGRPGARTGHVAPHDERVLFEHLRVAVSSGPLCVQHIAPHVTPPGPTHDEAIAAAHRASRIALGSVVRRLRQLQGELTRIDRLDGVEKISAIQLLNRAFARDIAVVKDKLSLGPDPLSAPFRAALDKACSLMEQNLSAKSGIIDEGAHGRCAPDHYSPPGIPFAATLASAPDPRVSACTPFFAQSAAMQRDVITHEFFHLLGLADMPSIATTPDALNDANTMAQIVAYLVDRTRTRDSSDMGQPKIPYPSP
jgi:hypothetical protein